jgi:heme-degrading monooxygenase HmoA
LTCEDAGHTRHETKGHTVIREHALLPVTPGREAEFEAAMRAALPFIAATEGFIDLSVSRSLETPNEYLLLVTWESVEAHTKGFRGSDRYPRWRAALHHFYDPMPVVEHFTEVITA